MSTNTKLIGNVAAFLVLSFVALVAIESCSDRRKGERADQRLLEVHARAAELGVPRSLRGLVAHRPAVEGASPFRYLEAIRAITQSDSFALMDGLGDGFTWPAYSMRGPDEDSEELAELFALLPELQADILGLQEAGVAGPWDEDLQGLSKLAEVDDELRLSHAFTISSLLSATAYQRTRAGHVDGALQCVDAQFALAETWRLSLRNHSLLTHLALLQQGVDLARQVLPYAEDPAAWMAALPIRGQVLAIDAEVERVELKAELTQQLVWFEEALAEVGLLEIAAAARKEGALALHVLTDSNSDYLEHHMDLLQAIQLPGPEALVRADALGKRVRQSDSPLLKLQAPSIEMLLERYLITRSSGQLLRLGVWALQFESETGAWPSSLSEFAPDFPVDALTGAPFLVEPEAGGVRVSSSGWASRKSAELTWLLRRP
mgnify:CR=1 FL=1